MNAATGGTVELTWRGPVAEIALANGPLNLVDKALLRALNGALGAVAARGDARCMILHGGQARAFCAGSDVREFDALREDASEHKILFEDMVLRRLAALPMPTIAAIDAPALGGGFELALACDLRVVRRGVPLGLPEARIGGLAGNGSVRLARLVGPARAKEMLFTGDPVTDDVALAWGLVNRVASEGSALDAARALADAIAARAAVHPAREGAGRPRARRGAGGGAVALHHLAAEDLRLARPARRRGGVPR